MGVPSPGVGTGLSWAGWRRPKPGFLLVAEEGGSSEPREDVRIRVKKWTSSAQGLALKAGS